MYQVRVITVFTVFRLLTDFVCLYNYEFWLSLCKIVRSSIILLLPLFSKVRTNKFYIFRQCTYIVSLSLSLSLSRSIDRYMWPSTLYTKHMLVLSVMNLFITPTFYLNFILILCFNQKAILMRSLMLYFGKDVNVLSNQNTWYSFFYSFVY
jgi:hypothetical protein